MSFKSFLQNSRFIICAHYINLQKYSKEITENNLIELLEFIKQNNIGYVTFKPELLQSSSRLKSLSIVSFFLITKSSPRRSINSNIN